MNVPAKPLSEQVRELRDIVFADGEKIAGDRRDIQRIDALIAKLTEDVRECLGRIRVLESQMDDVRKRIEEAERRRWQLWTVAIAAVLSLVANLVLTFGRK